MGKIIGYCYKNRTRCSKNYFQKIRTGELIGNKITEKNCKTKTYAWRKSEKCLKNGYHTKERTSNINISIIK